MATYADIDIAIKREQCPCIWIAHTQSTRIYLTASSARSPDALYDVSSADYPKWSNRHCSYGPCRWRCRRRALNLIRLYILKPVHEVLTAAESDTSLGSSMLHSAEGAEAAEAMAPHTPVAEEVSFFRCALNDSLERVACMADHHT